MIPSLIGNIASGVVAIELGAKDLILVSLVHVHRQRIPLEKLLCNPQWERRYYDWVEVKLPFVNWAMRVFALKAMSTKYNEIPKRLVVLLRWGAMVLLWVRVLAS